MERESRKSICRNICAFRLDLFSTGLAVWSKTYLVTSGQISFSIRRMYEWLPVLCPWRSPPPSLQRIGSGRPTAAGGRLY